MLPHAIYYDTLASIADESSDDWKATAAGLFVLRLVDDWFDFGPQIVTTDITGLVTVREAIAQISEYNPLRTILRRIVDDVERADAANVEVISPSILAYAQALLYEGRYELTNAALLGLYKQAKRVNHTETIILTSLRLGVAHRNLGLLDAAGEYQTSALQMATAIGDSSSIVDALLGHAKTIALRGDVGRADAMCARAFDTALELGNSSLIAATLQDRSYMAQLRGDYQYAIRLLYQSLEYTTDSRERDRTLADLSSAFVQIGHFAAARDTNLMLASCAQEQIIRWQAMLGLMFTAARERQEDMFHLYRASLACVQLSPREAISAHWIAGHGLRIFGDRDRAEEELQQAHALAEKHGMHQLVFNIEAELAQEVVETWSPDIDAIVRDLGEQLHLYTHSTL